MADVLKMKIQIKRGLADVLAGKVYAAGEPVYATDTHVLKFGDGVTAFAALPVANEAEWTADIAAAVENINTELAKKADASFVGSLPEGYEATTIVAYINEKAQEVLDSATGGSSESAASVKQQLDSYKTSNDARVKAVEDAIGNETSGLTQRVGAAEGDIDTLQAQLNGFATDTAAVKTVTDALAGRVKTVEDQTAANTSAITLLTDGVDPEKVDGVKDLITYVEEHGAEVTGIKADIAENATAISGLNTKVTSIETAINDESTGILARIQALEDDTTVDTHISDTVVHITGEERTKWNKAVADIGTVEEGKTVVDLINDVKTIAEAATTVSEVDAQIDTKIQALNLGGTYATISSVEGISDRVAAVEAASATHATSADLTAHTGNNGIHITAEERTLWTTGEVNVSRLVGTLVIDAGEEVAE